jgi:hypothetical protein
VLRDLVKVIRPGVTNEQVRNWNLRFLLRLDGVQQQQRVQPVCTLPTGTAASSHDNPLLFSTLQRQHVRRRTVLFLQQWSSVGGTSTATWVSSWPVIWATVSAVPASHATAAMLFKACFQQTHSTLLWSVLRSQAQQLSARNHGCPYLSQLGQVGVGCSNIC